MRKTAYGLPKLKKEPKNISNQIALILISGASLFFEINLTRLFSVTQFYHFAFMVISIALLGMGASGTFLSIFYKLTSNKQPRVLSLFAMGSGFSMLGAYLLINYLPFDSYLIAIQPWQALILGLHYLVLAAPFFFNGMIISLLLSDQHRSSSHTYANNLVGSAFGCVAALLFPAWLGAEGVVALSALIAGVSGILFLPSTLFRRGTAHRNDLVSITLSIILILITASIVGIRVLSDDLPNFFRLRISPYKSLSYALQPPDAKIISSQWNSYSRVDVVESSGLHSIPGLSFRYLGALPAINGIYVDGDNLNALLLPDQNLSFSAYLPSAVSYILQSDASVLILEPKGGMDILAAINLGANQITAVESNPLIIQSADWIYDSSTLDLLTASGRSFLRGSKQSFDIIQLPLTDSYHPVSSGAYALGEDYRFTVEAFSEMIQHLNPNGLLLATRWLQEEPSEYLRLFTIGVTALESNGLDPHAQIIAYRGYNTGTLLIKKSPLTSSEINEIRKFSDEKAFDLVYVPGIKETEINRKNILPEPIYYQLFMHFLNEQDRENFYQSYDFDITPPTDDHPFFGHYFKLSQMDNILNTYGVTWQPFGGAGYLVILIIFLLALVLSIILILLPVILLKKDQTQILINKAPFYFGLIGMGFMLVEIPLIQRFILYLDQPAYAFSVVLFCILLFSGLGSRYGSEKIHLSHALILLSLILTLTLFLLPMLIKFSLGIHLIWRVCITITLIAPIGFFLGIPFPGGLSWLRNLEGDHHLTSQKRTITWVWAVNGAASVLASILASLLSLSWGFTLTAFFGVGCYIIAWIIISRANLTKVLGLPHQSLHL